MSEWDAKTAEWYAENYGEYATNRLGVDALEDLSPSSVLDVGCGAGAALRHASLRWPAARLVGVDPVPRMIEIARERLEGHPGEGAVELKVGSAEDLPVDDGSFDLVLAFDSLDHWSDAEAGAREAGRVLTPNGRLVVVKDQGVPGHSDDVVELFQSVAGLELVRSQRVESEGVSFAMWVFKVG
jgi:ubiquinone/menaquinone biosynthesis C-methylase UbiE